ncbi:MAG: alpha-2-macroglobulin [Tannerella sp.]|jgi:uncharacterized protein YfaS (alpha-2-macroglobulin family)|nr:alpha-2-macroglobulin [Tannerella sp.]
MKRASIFFMALLPLLLLITLSSCKKRKDIIPPAEYASYVSAYTGGLISSNSSVRLELTQEQPMVGIDSEIKDKLFDFSPSLKGKAYWVNNKTLEFVPDSGELKAGTFYNASFALDKVVKVDKKMAKFNFSFRVEERNFVVRIVSLDVVEEAINKVGITGEIRFSAPPKPSDVLQMITAKRGKESFRPTVDPSENAQIYRFVINDIEKKEEDTALDIEVSGKAIHVDKKVNGTVVIPSLKPFKLVSAEIITTPEYGARLTFSEPVSDAQDLNGIITLDGADSYISHIRNNKIDLFFERKSNAQTLNLYVDQGLKSGNDAPLSKSSSVSLPLNSWKPNVEILSSGTIMPHSKSLLLPFSAVSLQAVDVKIIRIFESNILMFLQEHTLSSTSLFELRRAGRLVYKKTLRLDNDPTKNLHERENYSIDLSNIIKQEPGAIYQVELSFKQSYAVYPCDENHSPDSRLQASNSLVTVASTNLTEEEEALWDAPQYYYSDSDMDWDLYNWEERDNPCHPTYYMTADRKALTNVLASDLGMIVKSNLNNQLWIAVSDLLDTKPVENADVTVYNYQLQPIGSARTDKNGFAVINAKNKPFMVVASANHQKSYLRITEGQENMLSRFDVGGQEIKKGLKGFIYGERGIWRPGDTLHISFMLKDRERELPDTHPVSIEIYNPQGQFYQKQVSASGLNGLYTFAVPTQSDDPTGLWNAYVKVGGTSFHKSLRIETVKPNRLKIKLDIPGDKLTAADAAIPVTLQSVWLTGATARNLKTKLELSLSKTTTQFKGYEKYIFTNPATEFASSSQEIFDGTLNEQGLATFLLKMPEAKDAPGMLRAVISCSVFEQGGDASIYNQTIPFSPFRTYVGINFNQKPSEHYFETDAEHVFDIITLNSDGKPVNRSDLEYDIYRAGWSWWWGYDDGNTFASYLQNASLQPVASGQLHTVNGKAQLKFRIDYPEWGRYMVYVKDREGGHACGGTVYVDWPDWRGRSNKSNPDDIRMLVFSTDKTTYEAGDEATVIIPAAAGGRALLALENGSEVIRREWVEMPASGDAKYTFKVTEDMAPNVYVHISLLQPHEQTANDLPIRMYGVMPVFVTHKNSLLTPRITMPDALRPETAFTVSVKEANGKPMTYTLAIVDDGLLDLTGFKTPDPWDAFYSREALGIRTWDLYDDVMGAFAGKYGSMFSIGGDEGGGKPAASKANRFKPVVGFIGPFALKKGGEQAHQLRLPPYVGSVRVMVVAGQDGAYGSAEKTAPVRTPLMVLPSLPRVVSVGEDIVFPVNIFAMEEAVKNVSVKVETTGKLRLTNGQSQEVTFTAPGDQTVYFFLKSGEKTGIEKVTVTATGNGHTSKETIEIDVRNPNPPVIRAENKLLNPGESVDLAFRTDGAGDGNWIKLEASRIPSVDISRRFDFLYDYTHFCTEQLTSRALPLLFVAQFKEMDAAEAEKVKTNVRKAISNLYGRQLSDGSFAYWPGGAGDDWATSYAGCFLILAKEKGYEVNAGVLRRWESYQRRTAQSRRPDHNRTRRYYYDQSDLNQAYRLYALALAGAPEMGAMNRMKAGADISGQAKWRLAATYALAGKINVANELIFQVKSDVEPYALNNSTYGSAERDEAMILETFLLMGKEKEAFAQAQKVSRNLSAEHAFTTQSTAYALVAMGRLAEKVSGTLHFNWTLNGKEQPAVKSDKALFQKDLPPEAASGNVTLKNAGAGVLYVNLVSKTRPLRDSLPAGESNLRLDVSYTQLDGTPLDVARLKQGADFLAVIKVSNTSGNNDYTGLALTQIIPSGWEIHNERMRRPEDDDAGAGDALYTYRDIRDDRVLTYFDLPDGRFKVFKVRLQAAYAGSFVFPAIQCEAMYDTDVHARTKAGRVVVER